MWMNGDGSKVCVEGLKNYFNDLVNLKACSIIYNFNHNRIVLQNFWVTNWLEIVWLSKLTNFLLGSYLQNLWKEPIMGKLSCFYNLNKWDRAMILIPAPF